MKKTYSFPFLSLLFVFVFSFSLSAQTYVKHDATGSNNGSSWDNAYTDLSDALTNSNEGDQIWIAAGTYKPGGSTPTVESSFIPPHDVEIYGGFVGTETMLSERDYSTNETILSGDILGDDVDNNFSSNRTDNARHVMWLTDTISTATIIDGLTIRNGSTVNDTGIEDERRGGGILAYGGPTIRNCLFTQNYGWFGGALYPRFGEASGTTIENCEFLNNHGGTGGAIYVNSISDGIFDNCSFIGNTSVNSGGAIYNQNSDNFYADCEFEGNIAGTSAGAIYNTSSNMTIENCSFTDNEAATTTTGGAIRNSNGGTPITVTITDSDFSGNSAGWGGAMTNYSDGTIVDIENCNFEGNSAATSGGAIHMGFKALGNISNSDFMENNARFGAAVYCQNDTTAINLNSCLFESNEGVSDIGQDNYGGAVYTSGGNVVNIDDCVFQNNLATFAGALYIGDSDADLAMLNLSNSVVSLNAGEKQGGGINISNSDALITNCLINDNYSLTPPPDGMGTGGGMSINASDNNDVEVTIINSTIAYGLGELAAGIAQWTGTVDATATLYLQNTILHNPNGVNYAIEAGTPTVVSLGGNLSSDDSMTGDLTGTNDLNNTDPMFISDEDLHLQAGSPCIDAGIAAGAPTLDLAGNPRIGNVDMGAYEFDPTIGLEKLDPSFGKISIEPNPVADHLNFVFENEWTGKLRVRITDVKGTNLDFFTLEKAGDILTHQQNVNALPSGMYYLILSNGNQVVVQNFVKK